jgi:hypothetical protein
MSPAVGFALWCIPVNTRLEQDVREWIDWKRPIYARDGSWNHSALPVVPMLMYLALLRSVPVESLQEHVYIVNDNHALSKSWQGSKYVWEWYNQRTVWPTKFPLEKKASTERVCISIARISGLVFVPYCIYRHRQETLTTWLPTSYQRYHILINTNLICWDTMAAGENAASTEATRRDRAMMPTYFVTYHYTNK